MKRSYKAVRPEDATREETEEMNRQVKDLVNYLAKYDDPEFGKRLGKIENPNGVLILILGKQRKFERGLSTDTTMVTVGTFNPAVVTDVLAEWLTESIVGAMLGREIE